MGEGAVTLRPKARRGCHTIARLYERLLAKREVEQAHLFIFVLPNMIAIGHMWLLSI